jgi:hypothetical protein
MFLFFLVLLAVKPLPPCSSALAAGTSCKYVVPKECAPGMPPGTTCTWPDAEVLLLRGAAPGFAVSRRVAIVYGPELVPVPADAVRFGHFVEIRDDWSSCLARTSYEESASVSVITSPSCAVPVP